MQRRLVLTAFSGIAANVLSPFRTSQAQAVMPNIESPDWPSQPVRIMVGAPEGGGTDAMARAISDHLSQVFKQAVVIENHPGQSNTLAVDLTVKSVDGHTMVMGGASSNAIAPNLLKLAYDNHRALVPVAFVGAVPNVLVVANTSTAQNLKDLVALAKSKPHEIKFASSGVGSTQHLAAEVFKDATGLDIVHVPYTGSRPAQTDLLAGKVDMCFDTMPSCLAAIKRGQLRALGITSSHRHPQLPHVPSMAEHGLPNVSVQAWYGLYMPAQTPRDVVRKVNAGVNTVLQLPDTIARMQSLGAELRPMSQSNFATFNLAEYMRYSDIISKKKIKME